MPIQPRSSASRLQQGILMALMASFGTACSATSRIETAEITTVRGKPCFSIPHNFETRNGIPLYGVVVNDPKPAEFGTRPPPLWRFSVSPPGNSVMMRPGECIGYGEKPDNATAMLGPAKSLEPYYVYSVSLDARPPASNVANYYGQFCMKPAANGTLTVQTVSTDRSDKSRFEVCAKPSIAP